MKNFILWFLAFIITIFTAYYQKKTGPTYPKVMNVEVNDSTYKLKLVRSLGLDERPEVRLKIADTTVKARLHFRRFKTTDEFTVSEFRYKSYPVNSFVMNRIFKITEEKGLYAAVPEQPPAGKLEYFIEISDSKGPQILLKDNPVVIRFKGSVPSFILIPHILFMFLAMFLSTLAGLKGILRDPIYKKYSWWTLIALIAGGMILGPLVQKFAFGELWTGVPFGWDLTDNKTLIALIFWVIAVAMNRKKDRPFYTILAAIVLLVIFTIPHSIFGSELDYASGQVTRGFILIFFSKFLKNS
jgi:hypothetical protein